MSKTTDKLIDDIIELILGDMDCHHEVDHDEDGIHISVEYSLKDVVKLGDKIEALLQESTPSKIVREMIAINTVMKIINRMPEEKRQEFYKMIAKKVRK